MIKIKFNLLQIMTMNSLNVKHQGKSCNQLAFPLSAYSHLWKLWYFSDISEPFKVQFDCFKIQSLILMIKMIGKWNWMTWFGWTTQCKKNWKQHHIQNKSKFLPSYLINSLECTIQNILMSLNSLFELHMKSRKLVEY